MQLKINYFDHISSKKFIISCNIEIQELITDGIVKVLSRINNYNYAEIELNKAIIAKCKKISLKSTGEVWILL